MLLKGRVESNLDRAIKIVRILENEQENRKGGE